MAAYCGSCGQPMLTGARFCGLCGSAAPELPTSPAAPPTSYSAHAGGGSAGAVGSLVNEVQRLPVRTLLPLRMWWDQGTLRQGWPALFALAALAPFFLLHLGGDAETFHRVSWGFALYFAFLWFIALHTLIKPEPVTWGLLARVSVFTAIAGVAIAISLERQLATDDGGLLSYVVGVGIPEELAKALPVYLFLYRAAGSDRLSPTTFLFVGCVSGLAFGAAEAAAYSQRYAEVLPFLNDARPAIVTEVWRLVTDSLFHACMAGITGFFLGLARRYRSTQVALIGFGVLLASVLHGLYDDLAGGWGGTAVAVLIVAIFIGYAQTGEQITASLAETPVAEPR